MPSALIVLALLVAGGVGVTAENADPNDTLYPVKVNINEPLRSALQFSNSAEASWQANLVSRRLTESTRLATENDLSAESFEEIKEEIEENITNYDEKVDNLEEVGRYREIINVSSEFESTLETHLEILKGLRENETDEELERVNDLIEIIEEKLPEITETRVEAEAQISSQVNDQEKGEAEANLNGQITSTEKQISNAASFIERKSDDLEEEILTEANNRMEEARNSLEEARTEIENEAYQVAQDLLNKARRLTQSARVMVTTYGKVDLETKRGQNPNSNSDLETGNDREETNDDDQEDEEAEDEETSTEAESRAEVEAGAQNRNNNANVNGRARGRVNLDL